MCVKGEEPEKILGLRLNQEPPYPLPPIWVLLGGRGSGKNYAAVRHIYEYCEDLPPEPENWIVRVALVGATFEDVRATMIEGHSGLLTAIPEVTTVEWKRSVGALLFKIGRRVVQCQAYASTDPELLRGRQHHVAWVDEFPKFQDSHIDPEPITNNTTWGNLMFGLRLGTQPHVVATATPAPCALIKHIMNREDVKMTRMSSFDNSDHLPKAVINAFKSLTKDSRTYRQEVLGEIVEHPWHEEP